MREALNAEKKSILQAPSSMEEQVRLLLDGTINKLRIDGFYEATAEGKHITLHSTAPGCTENEVLGVFWSSLPHLARFFSIIHDKINPEVAIMADHEKAEGFVNELKGLQAKAVKKSDKAKKKVSQ